MRILYLLLLLLIISDTVVSQTVQAFGLSNTSDQYAAKAAYDNAGNLFVVGSFAGSNFDVDPSVSTFYLNSQGDKDFYIAKYTSTGTFINAISVGGTDLDEAISVALDASGNVYVTGWFRNTADFDPSGNVANVISNGHSMGTDMGYDGEVFLAKYNNMLAYQWAFNIGGAYVNDAGLSVKASGTDVIVAGNFRGSNVDFDPSAATANRSASGVIESFVAKYTSEGQFIWVSTIGGATSVSGQVRDLETDASQNIYVLGHFDGSVDLDPGAGSNVVNSAGCGDIYLVKLNPLGQHLWGFKVGGAGCDYPVSIASDGSDNFYITGYYSSSNVDFNPGPATNSFSSFNSNYDIFVGKYDQNGNYVFAHSFGGAGNDFGYDIHATSGSYILVGYFEGSIDIDPSGLTNTITSAGGTDGFVAGYYPNGQYNNGFRFGGTLNDAAYGVSKRLPNEFTITGYYRGLNVDFDPGAAQSLLSASGASDAFFAIYGVSVLPLKLVEFNAIRNNKQNDLKWITQAELNIGYFDVQKSANGVDFTSIGKVAASGTTNGQSVVYYHSDINPLAGLNYYRLRIVDKDGKYEFSPIKLISNESGVIAAIFPNPVNNILNVKLTADHKTNAEIAIIGLDGKVYSISTIAIVPGTTTSTLDIAFLSSGSYYLRLTTDQERLTLPFVK